MTEPKVYGSAYGGGKTHALKVMLDVIEIKTGAVVHTVETTRTKADKVQSGMLRNMDCARYLVRERDQ
jgi:ABC-type uncharacterized transport system ATPase subunit